eukprot:scaffold1869_cov122-Cylindrotheca_fusiformis.AAC.14
MAGLGRFFRGKPQASNGGEQDNATTSDQNENDERNADMDPPADDTAWMQFDQPLDFENDESFDAGNFDTSTFDFAETNEAPAMQDSQSATATVERESPFLGLSKFKSKAAPATGIPQATDPVTPQATNPTSLAKTPSVRFSTTSDRPVPRSSPPAGTASNQPRSVPARLQHVPASAAARRPATEQTMDLEETAQHRVEATPRSTNTNEAVTRQTMPNRNRGLQIMGSKAETSTRILPMPAHNSRIFPTPQPQQAMRAPVAPSNGLFLHTPRQEKQRQRSKPVMSSHSPTTPKDSLFPRSTNGSMSRIPETPQRSLCTPEDHSNRPSVTPSPVLANPPVSRIPSRHTEALNSSTTNDDSRDFDDLHAKFLSDIRDLQDLQDGNRAHLLTMENVFATAYSVVLHDQSHLSIVEQCEP